MDGKKPENILKLVKPRIRKLSAYSIDKTPVRVKLDAMENPFALPEELKLEISEEVKKSPINRYPDPSAKELKKAVAAFWNIDPERMMMGNGSDELIQAVILAFGGPVLFPDPTFAMYGITTRALSEKVAAVPLRRDFSLDADRLLRKAAKIGAKVIFLAVPNNPTGNRFSDEAVKKILGRAKAAVVIDEAYFDFSKKSWLPAINEYPNMILLRTLSKIGLAGLRIGAMTASQDILKEINKIRLPYNINMLSQVAAAVVLKHQDTLERQISLLISERERLYNALSGLSGITAYPTETNFILFRTVRDATIIFNKLKQAGILIKSLSKPGPLKNCLRVTVGTPEENNEFIKELGRILDMD